MPRRAGWVEKKHSLEQRVDAIMHLVDEYKRKSMRELCEALLHHREQKAEVEAQLQQVSEHIEAISEALASQFISEELSSQRYDDLGTFALTHKLYVSTEDKGTYFEWLKAHQLEHLIQPHVPPKTTEALVRERLEEGLSHDGMGLKVSYKVTVR